MVEILSNEHEKHLTQWSDYQRIFWMPQRCIVNKFILCLPLRIIGKIARCSEKSKKHQWCTDSKSTTIIRNSLQNNFLEKRKLKAAWDFAFIAIFNALEHLCEAGSVIQILTILLKFKWSLINQLKDLGREILKVQGLSPGKIIYYDFLCKRETILYNS